MAATLQAPLRVGDDADQVEPEFAFGLKLGGVFFEEALEVLGGEVGRVFGEDAVLDGVLC